MSIEKDGGPAFPVAIPDESEYYLGLSLRDYFAGQALAGMLSANPVAPHGMTEQNVDTIMAREAYRTADAMLKARKG